MKKLSLLIAVFPIVITSYSQISGGLKAGLNLETMNGNPGVTRMKPGIHLGGYFNISLSEKLSVQPEILFSSAGSQYEVNLTNISSLEFNTSLSYLNVPLSLQYSFGKFNIYTGPQIGFLLKAKSEIYETIINNNGKAVTMSVGDIKNFLKDVDFCLNFGVGYNLGKWAICGRYSLGMLNLYKYNTEYNTIKNRVIQISVTSKLFGK